MTRQRFPVRPGRRAGLRAAHDALWMPVTALVDGNKRLALAAVIAFYALNTAPSR